MYGGSSGCPVFKTDGNVFGMQSATLVAEEGANE
jgi:V8-like Glu-specific endopeptidase